MTDSANSQTQAKVWLKPDQVDALRTAVFRCRPPYLQGRDDAIIAMLYDTGLRAGELTALTVGHLRENNTRLYLPGAIQKDYPTKASPDAVRMRLASDTTRSLSSYLANRWKDTTALFPSRSSDRRRPSDARDRCRRGRGPTVPSQRVSRRASGGDTACTSA